MSPALKGGFLTTEPPGNAQDIFCHCFLTQDFVTQKKEPIIGLVVSSMQGFTGASVVKNSPAMQETLEMKLRSLSQEDPLEKEMATHSSILDGKIPQTEEPGGLQSTRVTKELDVTDVTEHTHTNTHTIFSAFFEFWT